MRRESLRPLHYLYLSGAELERGLLKFDTPQGKVCFGLPLHALRFYFPALLPEAKADAES